MREAKALKNERTQILFRALFGQRIRRMGIDGLFPLVKPAAREAHARDFRGKTVAVDAMCW